MEREWKSAWCNPGNTRQGRCRVAGSNPAADSGGIDDGTRNGLGRLAGV